MNSRTECPLCGRCVQVRLDGALRLHRTNHHRTACPGGGRNFAEEARLDAWLEQAAKDCAALGMSHIWEAVIADPLQHTVRDIVGSVARCLVETGVVTRRAAA